MKRRHTTSCRFVLENLDPRLVFATNVFVDFGFAWEDDVDTASGIQQGLNLNGSSGLSLTSPSLRGPGASPHRAPSIRSLDQLVQDGAIDYDGDGFVTGWDSDAIAADTLALVQQVFAPFDVNVVAASAHNLDAVADFLALSSTNDVYILAGGTWSTASGLAPLDSGNVEDNVGIAYAGNALLPAYDPSTNSVKPLVAQIESIASTIAHEAAHTFGLDHTGRTLVELPSDGDVMSHFRGTGSRFLRFDLPLAEGPSGRTQNSYEILRDVLGTRPNSPAYVTGTGAHDKILVTSISSTSAIVTVQAYSDPSHAFSTLIEGTEYVVDITNGVLIEGSLGNDWIHVDIGGKSSIIHGGSGNDVLLGGAGADTLLGGIGDDTINGGIGNDVYRFDRSSEYDFITYELSRLGQDTIDDDAGTDQFDFTTFGRSVTVDLARTDAQRINTPPSLLAQWLGTVDPGPYLTLVLTPQASGVTTVENILGSPGNDTLRGNAANNRLEGAGGSDLLEGRGGNDNLVGGTGSDTYVFSGGSLGLDVVTEATSGGTDRLDFSQFSSAVTINLSTGSTQTVSTGQLSLRLSGASHFENVTGSAYADVIRGNAAGNLFEGGLGNDYLTGGDGDDTLRGGGGNDSLYGESGRDSLFGEAGNDYLDGGADGVADSLTGGAGKDTFVDWAHDVDELILDFWS